MKSDGQKIVSRDQNGEVLIDLKVLFFKLLHRWWILLLAAILGGSLFFAGAKLLITPKYRSGFAAYVNNGRTQLDNAVVSSSDVMASQSMAKAYAEIISRRAILEEAAQKIGLDYAKLKGTVTAKEVSSMEIVEVNVVTEDPQVSYNLAKSISEVIKSRGQIIIDGSNFQMFDPPVLSNSIYSPSYVKAALIGALVFLLAAALIIFIRDMNDDRIVSAGVVEEQMKIPMLGCIPMIRDEK